MSVAPTPGRIKLPVKDQQLEDLLLWRDVKKTGIVFGAVTAAFVLLFWAKNSFLSVAALLMSLTVGVMLVWSIIGGFIHRPPPPMPAFMVEGIAEAKIRAVVEKATPYVNKGLNFTHRILSGKDVLMSIVVSAGLFFLSKVLATVSLLGLAYACVVLAFAVPKVYEMYHDQIDNVIDIARQKVTFIHDAYLSKLLKMIPSAQTVTPAESSSARKED
mmetsp:Transcript_3460/g.7022  ORF Transcript_3460/g.7022 Transcript_3460/m.7022 type:complete len:216 (-) Transcript_3460:4015-4662(-)